MFWKRLDSELSQHRHEELRTALADRLRAALDFATLGAYELTPEFDYDDPAAAPAGAGAAQDPHDSRETDRERARPTAFAGTRQHPEPKPHHRCDRPAERPRLHVSTAGHSCVAGESAAARDCTWARASDRDRLPRASRKLGRGDRRPGAVAPEQPCTWAVPGR